MADVKIKILDDAPLEVNGNVELVDGEGSSFKLENNGEAIHLCRCGLSQNKPYCDGAHQGKFESKVRVK